MSFIITDAGIAAAIRAGDLGIEYKITHISIGSEGYVPEPAQTELRNELQKKAITRGALVAPGQLHFETVWDGVEEFEGKELGYWLEDGTLFAVDSRDGDIITYKRKNTVVTEACELNLSASTISNITVELLGSPYATETVAGIAKVATSEQVETGTNDSAFLTVKKFLYALDVTQVIDKLVNNLWLKLAARIFPVGAAIPWFTDVAPDGFGMMKGQAFDINTYTELAAIWPNGIIPDMRGCGVIGKEDGETIGVYEEGEVKEHGHDGSSVYSTNLGSFVTRAGTGNHEHQFALGGVGGSNYPVLSNGHGGYRNTEGGGAHQHWVDIGSHAHTVAIALFGALKNTINHRKVNWIVRLA
ncbi:phage tail protein [Vibrio diazotrophicus]|uniref:Phage tail protein n=1 Tax=Vibrio diazotrophicus TaxID=685 RepID=A0A2J8I6T1_VIBDI|nr:phage tail protein [Vibrio diazotrophicus]PNI06184.1 phage tail protein [Vibrio diazotrophicus]